jgi:hypothetical protein
MDNFLVEDHDFFHCIMCFLTLCAAYAADMLTAFL